MASPVETVIRRTVAKGVMKVADFNRGRLPAPARPHTFLSGLHTPMTEEITVEDLKVVGEIPPELDGRYVRIGPNPVGPANPAAYHWFTGDGMVHGVRLKDGKALWYRNRWIRTTAVSAALGEPPAPGPRNGPSGTVNTNVLGHAGKIWALVEAGSFPVEIDGDLATVTHNPFEGTLKGAFTAHPHLDPQTGEMHAICYAGDDPDVIRHVVVTAEGRVRREEPVAVANGPSIHDCALTPNYVLIFDLPVTFSMKSLIEGRPFPYRWNPDHRARVGLLAREGAGADTVWCDVEPCYVFHPCNAFETGDGRVVVDVAAYPTMFSASHQGPDSTAAKFERWTIDPATKTVDRAVLDAAPQEFPRCDERLTGQPYRYAYAMPLANEQFVSRNYLIRHDLKTGSRQRHDFGIDRHPGEFVFVPKHPGAAEEAGWLMGYVINAAEGTTDLVIIDGQNFTGPPQAVITIPHRVPPGFHGNWVAAA